jgi:glycerol-3-phosphate dehydrogenase
MLPEIEPSDLIPAYSGIRAKLAPPAKHGEKRGADFIIQPDPRFPRVAELIGIESPGLTSAPFIAEQVRRASGRDSCLKWAPQNQPEATFSPRGLLPMKVS